MLPRRKRGLWTETFDTEEESKFRQEQYQKLGKAGACKVHTVESITQDARITEP
jgi:hypothetical protein